MHCLLQIITFRNVALIKTGLFKLHITLGEHRKEKATPKTFWSGTSFRRMNEKVHNIGGSSISVDEKKYSSSGFLIKYEKEAVKIGDVCVFECPLKTQSALTSPPLILSIRLMYCRSYSQMSHSVDEAPPDSLFQEEALVRIVIENSAKGIFEFHKIEFDDLPSSTLECIVATSCDQWNVTNGAVEGNLQATFNSYLKPLVIHFHKLHSTIVAAKPQISDFAAIAGSFQSELTVPQVEADLLQQFGTQLYRRGIDRPASEVFSCLQDLMNCASASTVRLLNLISTLLIAYPNTIIAPLATTFVKSRQNFYENVIFREEHQVDCIPLENNDELSATHKMMAEARRSESQRLPTVPRNLHEVEDTGPSIAVSPILFEESYRTPAPPVLAQPLMHGYHLVVLVHGYDGSPTDVLFLKTRLANRYNENIFFLCSRYNDQVTHGDIFEMGQRLAREVHDFCDGRYPETLGKLSFIGYSQGGVVARAALTFLQEWSGKMHAFVSLGSPHLGLMYTSSSLIDAGLWLVRSWTRSKGLEQLAMADNSDMTQTAVYCLSQHQGLSWFQHVLLFSSTQDSYSPLESSRIELSKKALNGSDKGCFYVEMAWKLISPIKPERLRRVDVDFYMSGVSLDSLIGRKAHTEFIENQQFFDILAEKFPEVFA